MTIKGDNVMKIITKIYTVIEVSNRMITETTLSLIGFLFKIKKLSVSFNKRIKLMFIMNAKKTNN